MFEKDLKIENREAMGDMDQLMAEIEERKAELLTKQGAEREAMEIEIEKLQIQYNALKKFYEDIQSGKLKK